MLLRFWCALMFIWRQESYLTMEVNHYWWCKNCSNCVFTCFVTHLPHKRDSVFFFKLCITLMTNRCRYSSVSSFGNNQIFKIQSTKVRWASNSIHPFHHLLLYSCYQATGVNIGNCDDASHGREPKNSCVNTIQWGQRKRGINRTWAWTRQSNQVWKHP